MKMSELFNRTLREAPSEADTVSHQLLLRAGYIQPFGAGVFAYLPLGLKAVENLSWHILKNMHVQDMPVVRIPLVQPVEGQLPKKPFEIRFDDLQGRELLLAERYEMAAMWLAQNHIQSHRQLPVVFTCRGQNWHNTVHPSSGLMNAHIDEALQVFGFFATQNELENRTAGIEENMEAMFKDHRTPVTKVEGVAEHLSLAFRHEWHYASPYGRDGFFRCPGCGYTASTDAVRFHRQPPWDESFKPLQKISTPYCTTIESLASYLEVPKERTAKMIFMVAAIKDVEPPGNQQLIFAVVPGDRDLDEQRLAHVLDATSLRAATEEEIRTVGAVPGYGSPIGIANAYVVVDAQVPLTSNMVCGANEEGYHLINVNFGRDFTAQKIAEISVPRQGDSCPNCGFPMEMIDSIRLADISVPDLQHTILDARSNQVALHGLICSISLNRLLACMVEENHDEYGIIWPPVSSAPFAVHLILIGEQDSMAGKAADEIYQRLRILGLEALYDERPERAGVKFMDADLIGIPLRITVSQRTLSQNAVEFKQRSAKESRLVGIAVIDSEVENIYKQHNQDHKDMIP